MPPKWIKLPVISLPIITSTTLTRKIQISPILFHQFIVFINGPEFKDPACQKVSLGYLIGDTLGEKMLLNLDHV